MLNKANEKMNLKGSEHAVIDVISQYLLIGTEENKENPQDCQYPADILSTSRIAVRDVPRAVP
jgi:hypothetical protein